MDEDFNKLLEDVVKNPEMLLNPELVSNDQLIELQKKLNPYINLTNNEERQIAACSYTNLREDYIRRFTITSLVSFIFQVLHEHEVPKEKLIFKNEKINSPCFTIKELKDKLSALQLVLSEAEDAEIEEIKLKKDLNMKELLEEDSTDNIYSNLNKKIYSLEEKKIGLIFTLTHMIKEFGVVADTKITSIKDVACKYPGIKDIIKNKKPSNKEFNIIPESQAKDIINDFLIRWLSFDPSYHIREGHNLDKIKTEVKKAIDGQDITIDPEDPGHLTIESLRSKIVPTKEDAMNLEYLFKDKRACSSAINIIRDANLYEPIKYMLSSDDTIDRFKQYLMPLQKLKLNNIPPQDTFHRWNYFTEVNYEEIRTITECLYPERPDLDWAVAIWTTFKGTDEELDKQFNDYCQKHQDELPSSIRSIEIGKWTLLGDFKENRKNLQFYNKNTEVLKRIIDRHTEDKKIGTELMRNRVRQVKAKNIEEEGPDAPGLKNYKSAVSSDGKDLSSKGVEKVITPEEMKRLEKTRGNLKAAKELEVLEEYENIMKGLDEIKKYRELTTEEIDKYSKAELIIKQAKEMLNVPDDAIQVDVFTTDAKSGTFSKSHFYTKCEEALE
jgi:hypothetical protein